MVCTAGRGTTTAVADDGLIEGVIGCWCRLRPVRMLLELASNCVSGARWKTLSIMAGIDAVSSWVLSTWPARAYGETRMVGTRRPTTVDWPSWFCWPMVGGTAWSYHPPESS